MGNKMTFCDEEWFKFVWKYCRYILFGVSQAMLDNYMLQYEHKSCGKSYRGFTIISYNSRAIQDIENSKLQIGLF